MVVGFVLFWPVGLCVLLWSISGRDVRELPEAISRQWSRIAGTWAGAWGGHNGDGARGPSDNTVFEEFQQAQRERIREIRDEIKDRARRFRDFRADAKRRADEEEFNRFMSGGPTRGDG
jgi:hypothetical protein